MGDAKLPGCGGLVVAANDWTAQEIDQIVSDYFTMLSDELAGLSYNKAEHRRALLTRIDRSAGSIEFKHQNISAVMLGLGQPWIEGYKPAANFQAALVDGVLRWLDTHEDWLLPRGPSYTEMGFLREGQKSWTDPRFEPFLNIGPVPTERNEPAPIDTKFMAAIGRKYDVAARDARNRALGKAGEALVLAHEQARLQSYNRMDLAKAVRWTAVEDGDGYGYDIASFEPDGSDRLLEVKTTNGWDRTPFYLTRNEIAVAEERKDNWHLLRVWNFARTPQAFAIRPPLRSYVDLTPINYLAVLR